MVWMSLEKRDMMRPMGVVSKNRMGARMTRSESQWCRLIDALTPITASTADRRNVNRPSATATRA